MGHYVNVNNVNIYVEDLNPESKRLYYFYMAGRVILIYSNISLINYPSSVIDVLELIQEVLESQINHFTAMIIILCRMMWELW